MTYQNPQKIKSLLRDYSPKTIKKARKLKFEGVEKRDVYNPTAPFRMKTVFYLLGRVEPREEETSTRLMFFRRPRRSRIWHADETCPVFNLQDPFIINFNNTFVVGGIEVQQRAVKKIGLSWRTVFYKGNDIHNLRKFAHGPWGMKGIRFVALPNRQIGVFTRPQGKKGRRGKIGFTMIDSLKKLAPRTLSKAKIIPGQFARGEWGGVNEIHFLENGKIGILGHIAKMSKGRHRHYYPITFAFDPEMGVFSRLKIIATRQDLPKGETKRADLQDVLYPGGIIRNGKGTAKLYVGVSDAEAYELTIEDPFLEYEEEYPELWFSGALTVGRK